ncbi:D-alanyl-D-alanine carboxypeptidase family protein [Cohnella panacarvi]|uniref:D-alanyl-D-alanine carboxypeptidase family protein n=1 Tax=Cohnella panacarvi TaxID=400776 RepID=UPI00047C62B5|nr:D-alanyl-D-alanine carboxypeptidase family protein [Cohnella panacarvi]
MHVTSKAQLTRRMTIAAVLLGSLIFSGCIPARAGAAQASTPVPPANRAKGVSLIDVASGRIIYSKQGDEPMLIASLTKIMTAIVAIEHGRLDDQVTVSKRAEGKEGSSIYLKAGEKIQLRNLIYGLMLRSGNDAATAIAEHVGGSVGGFAFLMNKKAAEIGLSNSQYMNPHGLDEPGHYASANDLAKLTAYALHNPDFRTIVATRVRTAPNPHDPWDYKWVNKNKMLHMYDGADGVKTGYTKKALRCLVSSATRNGQQLVVVTLNDGDDWADHRKLLDYGFAHYPLTKVASAGDPVLVAAEAGKLSSDYRYPLAAGEREKLTAVYENTDLRRAVYSLGYRGWMNYYLNGERIGSVSVVASDRSPDRAEDQAGKKGAG